MNKAFTTLSLNSIDLSFVQIQQFASDVFSTANEFYEFGMDNDLLDEKYDTDEYSFNSVDWSCGQYFEIYTTYDSDLLFRVQRGESRFKNSTGNFVTFMNEEEQIGRMMLHHRCNSDILRVNKRVDGAITYDEKYELKMNSMYTEEEFFQLSTVCSPEMLFVQGVSNYLRTRFDVPDTSSQNIVLRLDNIERVNVALQHLRSI